MLTIGTDYEADEHDASITAAEVLRGEIAFAALPISRGSSQVRGVTCGPYTCGTGAQARGAGFSYLV